MKLTPIGRALAVTVLTVSGLLAGVGAVMADGGNDHPWAPQRDIHGKTDTQVTVRRVVVNNQDGQGDVVYLCFRIEPNGVGQSAGNCVRQPSTTAAG